MILPTSWIMKKRKNLPRNSLRKRLKRLWNSLLLLWRMRKAKKRQKKPVMRPMQISR